MMHIFTLRVSLLFHEPFSEKVDKLISEPRLKVSYFVLIANKTKMCWKILLRF